MSRVLLYENAFSFIIQKPLENKEYYFIELYLDSKPTMIYWTACSLEEARKFIPSPRFNKIEPPIRRDAFEEWI